MWNLFDPQAIVQYTEPLSPYKVLTLPFPVSKTGRNAVIPPAESYAFYMALTDAILALTARVRRDDPAQLFYEGLNLSHAFEAAAYFGCVHDPGLLALFADPENASAVTRLKTQLAHLLAIESFATGAALRAVKQHSRLRKTLRAVKRAGQLLYREPLAPAVNCAVPVLLFGSSARFTRFLRPVAQSLGEDCAFLVPAQDKACQALVREWGFRVLRYGPPTHPRGSMGSLVDDCARHLASQAQALRDVLPAGTRLVVVAEGNSPEDEILARIAEQRGVASACIQQGWSPILHPGFRNMRYSEMVVWGEGFAGLLAPLNPDQRFSAAGNFNLPTVSSPTGSGVLFFFQGFDNWLGGRASSDAMLTLAEEAARALPGSPVYVRPHPAIPFPAEVCERLGKFPNIHIEKSSEVTLAEALAKVRVSVSAYSTTILESIAAGVVPLVFNTTDIPRYWPDVATLGAGLEIREPDAALAALRRLLIEDGFLAQFQQPMAAFTARFFHARGAEALAATTACLRRLTGLG